RSPMDAVLPDFWPISESEARAFLAAQPGDSHYVVAWLARSVSIVGTIPGTAAEVAGAAGGSGLRGGATWRFHTDDAALYTDSALLPPLFHFASMLQRVAQPILGTPAEQSPHPVGPMPLNDEAALLLLQHQGIPPDITINWQAAAVDRLRS